ncbi:TfoX/Sxy family protein [Portibacter marinus]|uniref:TfoX/Sxy family protein n=1 Tax=Portibacter marinus TaxID=2898660 RepID=UPI001F3F856D|nr:TfoX/Sxy family protein [Portibacter marinus]
MAYDQHLADRVNSYLERNGVSFYSRKMFGGLCFMVNDKMCVGIRDDMIMARIDPKDEAELRKLPGVRDMDFTGRPMKGFLYVGPEAIDAEKDLEFVLQKALAFNPNARRSEKRKTS